MSTNFFKIWLPISFPLINRCGHQLTGLFINIHSAKGKMSGILVHPRIDTWNRIPCTGVEIILPAWKTSPLLKMSMPHNDCVNASIFFDYSLGHSLIAWIDRDLF